MTTTADQLIERIQQDIAALRACAIDPMSIQLTDVIDIEIRPSSEDDRVLVGRKDWGLHSRQLHLRRIDPRCVPGRCADRPASVYKPA